MRKLAMILAVLLAGLTLEAKQVQEGFVFKIGDKFYLSERPNTQSMRFELKWHSTQNMKSVCLPTSEQLCAMSYVSYLDKVVNNGRVVLIGANVITSRTEARLWMQRQAVKGRLKRYLLE